MDKGLQFVVSNSFVLVLPAPNMKHLGGAWQGLLVFSVLVDWCTFTTSRVLYLFKSTFRP